MFKVYLDNKLIGEFKCSYEAAIFAQNKDMYLPIGVNTEVWGPKTDFIHFNVGQKK